MEQPPGSTIRHVAFLRAIHVGGRVVKMDILRSIFEEMGFSSVETFIASGNVIFQTAPRDERALIQESRFSSGIFEHITGQITTARTMNTIRRLGVKDGGK